MSAAFPRVSAVVLAWGREPVLVDAVQALLASRNVEIDVVLVDNGCLDDAVESVRRFDRVTVISPGSNTGFAGGCNLGARHARGDILAFINADAVVDPYAIRRLADALVGDVGLASASLRLYDEPQTMNSAGNPIHYTGLSWAGGMGEPAAAHAEPQNVASATGAAVAVRADRFRSVGGFCQPMFAYCEDAELSLRCWQRGWRTVYVPDAVVLHRYEFSRNPQKFYLLERNRIFMVLTTLQVRTLIVLAPALIGVEFAVFLVSGRQGWRQQKVAGWRWLWKHRGLIAARRRLVQSERLRSDRQLADVFTGDFAPSGDTGLSIGPVLRALSRMYWALARRALQH
jgi:GT2 family glycosyltransferase